MKPWDEYFLGICNQVAANSKCLSQQRGAILVRDRIIIATGYNGPPRGFRRCPDRWRDPGDPLTNEIRKYREPKSGFVPIPSKTCPRRVLGFKSGERLDLCPAVHAEANCIAAAARAGVNVNHTIMYMNCQVPCKWCMGLIINAGISILVVTSLEPYDRLTLTMVRETSGSLTVRDYDWNFLPNLSTPSYPVAHPRYPTAHEGDIK